MPTKDIIRPPKRDVKKDYVSRNRRVAAFSPRGVSYHLPVFLTVKQHRRASWILLFIFPFPSLPTHSKESNVTARTKPPPPPCFNVPDLPLPIVSSRIFPAAVASVCGPASRAADDIHVHVVHPHKLRM